MPIRRAIFTINKSTGSTGERVNLYMNSHTRYAPKPPRTFARALVRMDEFLNRRTPEFYRARAEQLGRAIFGELFDDPSPAGFSNNSTSHPS